MATFAYQSAGAGGAATIEAPDRASAVRELLRRGVTPTAVEAVDGPHNANGVAEPHRAPSGAAGGGAWSFRAVMSRAEMASFIRELATAVQAGLPLVTALRTIGRQGR